MRFPANKEPISYLKKASEFFEALSVCYLQPSYCCGYLCLFLLLLAAPLKAQELSIHIEGREAWDAKKFQHVDFLSDSPEENIITLQSNERVIEQGTDMLLHFNGESSTDETQNYALLKHPIYSKEKALFGKAAAFFQGRGGLEIKPDYTSFLGSGIIERNFSIDFWFYPFFSENGEVLFEWEGQLRLGDSLIPQRISATFQENRIVWQFRNVFLNPQKNTSFYEISSGVYIPEQWHHHQLVYDAGQAHLEVFDNGSLEGISYTTMDGLSSNKAMILMINNPRLTAFRIGPRYFGLLDEWVISHAQAQQALRPAQRYYDSGVAYSKILDLGAPNSNLEQIHFENKEPEESRILKYYAISNERYDLLERDRVKWYRIENWEKSIDSQILGRFLQFKLELLADTRSNRSPEVSGVSLKYRVGRKALPPSNIQFHSTATGVALSWQPSARKTVQGYKVYLGTYSGQYLEEGYPMDVGNSTKFTFTGLKPKQQYFFVIAPYERDGTKNVIIGEFSEEYSFRYLPTEAQETSYGK